jgi:phosphoribosyl-ATP pyrophosphohydrolase
MVGTGDDTLRGDTTLAQGSQGLGDAVRQLEADLARVREDRALAPRTARLLGGGVPKMAKKLAEEAVEVALDAVRGERRAVIAETADLLYNLVVLLDGLGIRSEEVWAEMERRRRMFGIAEKLRKPSDDG